jgi:hypothetical protein
VSAPESRNVTFGAMRARAPARSAQMLHPAKLDGSAKKRALVDAALFVAITLSFATFVTAHVALALGLTLRAPRWHGPLSFVVPPLAPYWGLQAGFRARAACWVGGVLAYSASLLIGALVGR